MYTPGGAELFILSQGFPRFLSAVSKEQTEERSRVVVAGTEVHVGRTVFDCPYEMMRLFGERVVLGGPHLERACSTVQARLYQNL